MITSISQIRVIPGGTVNVSAIVVPPIVDQPPVIID
jgi:hypothetical protein